MARTLFALLFIVSLFSVGCCFSVSMALDTSFNEGCEQYLWVAAHVKAPSEVKRNMNVALEYLKGRGLTEGSTSPFFPAPSADIGEWYAKLEVLAKDGDSQKVREAIIQVNRHGEESVIVPQGVKRHPHQTILAIWLLFSLIGVVLGLVFFVSNGDNIKEESSQGIRY